MLRIVALTCLVGLATSHFIGLGDLSNVKANADAKSNVACPITQIGGLIRDKIQSDIQDIQAVINSVFKIGNQDNANCKEKFEPDFENNANQSMGIQVYIIGELKDNSTIQSEEKFKIVVNTVNKKAAPLEKNIKDLSCKLTNEHDKLQKECDAMLAEAKTKRGNAAIALQNKGNACIAKAISCQNLSVGLTEQDLIGGIKSIEVLAVLYPNSSEGVKAQIDEVIIPKSVIFSGINDNYRKNVEDYLSSIETQLDNVQAQIIKAAGVYPSAKLEQQKKNLCEELNKEIGEVNGVCDEMLKILIKLADDKKAHIESSTGDLKDKNQAALNGLNNLMKSIENTKNSVNAKVNLGNCNA